MLNKMGVSESVSLSSVKKLKDERGTWLLVLLSLVC